jgi:predicted enzyme related to lactoylglutathione lyase
MPPDGSHVSLGEAMADGIPVTGVSELVLEVRDLDRAERFYAEAIGFPVVERWQERGAVWVMAGARTRLGLWRPQVGLAGGRGGIHVHYALQIDEGDFDDAVERLRLAGYEPERLSRSTMTVGDCPLRDRSRRQCRRVLDLGCGRAPEQHLTGNECSRLRQRAAVTPEWVASVAFA